MYVNMFCVIKQIFVFFYIKNSVLLFVRIWKLNYCTPFPRVALPLRMVVFLQKKTALLAVVCCSLDESSSPRHIITCTRSFRAEVSYSSVVLHRCVTFAVQGS